MLYVWFFLFLWLWPALHRLTGTVGDIPFFDVMGGITVSGQAFVLAVIRLSEPSATSALKRMLWRLRPCCCRSSDPPECLRAPLVASDGGGASAARRRPSGGPGAAAHETDAMAEATDSWDFGAKLRLEQAMCMLSGMCQALAAAEEWAPRAARAESVVAAAVAAAARGGDADAAAVPAAAAAVEGSPASSTSAGEADDGNHHFVNPLALAADRSSPLALPPGGVAPAGTSLLAHRGVHIPPSPAGAAHRGSSSGDEGGGGGRGAPPALTAADAAAVLLHDISALMASPSTVSKLCAPLFDFNMDSLSAAMASARPVDVRTRPPRARSIRIMLGSRGDGGAESSGGEDESKASPRSAPDWGRSGSTQFELTAFCADQFKRLRDAAGVTERRIVDAFSPRGLITRALHAHFSDGASSSFFCKSGDGSLVVKTLEAFEVVTLIDMLPAYVSHLMTNPDSLLCRFYGCFAMQVGGAM